jgi:DNA-binding GntR family transcriptional regulator
VREALRELAREGLVAELPRRGTVVSTLTARDLAEVYGVREGLEMGACGLLIEQVNDGEFSALEVFVAAIEEHPQAGSDYLAVAESDFMFHRRLIALTRNDRLITIYENMLAQTALLLRTAAKVNPELRTDMARPVHSDMLNALLARDTVRARVSVENHYIYAKERLFAQFV